MSKLPSGRFRAQVWHAGRSLSVPKLIGGPASYATRKEAVAALEMAARKLGKDPEVQPHAGPFITIDAAALWAGQSAEKITRLAESQRVPAFRLPSGELRVCENSLGLRYGLELPGPRARELAARKPPETYKPSPPVNDPNWLYWFYDEDERLLYVGITRSGVKRMEQHGAEKTWWPEVRRIMVDHFAARDEALKAEEAAIRKHRSLYNGTHNRRAA